MALMPVLYIQVGHAGLCPQFVGVRADSFVSHRDKSVDNGEDGHDTENIRPETYLKRWIRIVIMG